MTRMKIGAFIIAAILIAITAITFAVQMPNEVESRSQYTRVDLKWVTNDPDFIVDMVKYPFVITNTESTTIYNITFQFKSEVQTLSLLEVGHSHKFILLYEAEFEYTETGLLKLVILDEDYFASAIAWGYIVGEK